ncbi:MAG: four helix bundle protein [Patescibacteria group bacterium]
MKIERFEDIVAWQKAKILTIEIYKIFDKNRDFGFRDQIRRASVSIMNNIAEGFERKGDKEFKNFLFIAKGSCGEVRSMLCLAQELRYIAESEFTTIYNLSLEISKILSGFIKILN